MVCILDINRDDDEQSWKSLFIDWHTHQWLLNFSSISYQMGKEEVTKIGQAGRIFDVVLLKEVVQVGDGLRIPWNMLLMGENMCCFHDVMMRYGFIPFWNESNEHAYLHPLIQGIPYAWQVCSERGKGLHAHLLKLIASSSHRSE